MGITMFTLMLDTNNLFIKTGCPVQIPSPYFTLWQNQISFQKGLDYFLPFSKNFCCCIAPYKDMFNVLQVFQSFSLFQCSLDQCMADGGVVSTTGVVDSRCTGHPSGLVNCSSCVFWCSLDFLLVVHLEKLRSPWLFNPQCVTNIILILNPKHKTIPVIMRNINSILTETRTMIKSAKLCAFFQTSDLGWPFKSALREMLLWESFRVEGKEKI